METDQILDLFNLGEGADGLGVDGAGAGAGGHDFGPGGREEDLVDGATGEVREKGKKGWLDDLGELGGEVGQYEEEFDLEGFLGRMKG